ncbi:hypothetical protein IWW50_004292 [Coemansia erecta]|nr:hypothetical protein IWW50_004292 [Coemansia erecta]
MSPPASDDDRADAHGGSQKPPFSFSDFVAAHRFEDLTRILEHEPCAREGLLYGIGAGTGAAFLGLLKRGSLVSAGNWGFLTFGVMAIASKQLCHYQQSRRRARNRTLLGIALDADSNNVENFKPSATTQKPNATTAENSK